MSEASPDEIEYLDFAVEQDAAEGIRQGIEDMEAGRWKPAWEFFLAFEEEHPELKGLTMLPAGRNS